MHNIILKMRMNCGVFLLLVATLSTSSCVHAVQITVENAKQAIQLALYKLDAAEPGDEYMPVIKLQGERGTMSYEVKNSFYNCGLKPDGKFLLPESQVQEIENWFGTQTQLAYKCVKPPQKKPELGGGDYVNLFGKKGNRWLNYHLQVDLNAKTSKEQFLKTLLSQLLE